MQIREQVLERLQKGAEVFACGSYLAQLDSLHQTDIYTSLGFERLDRKNRDIQKYTLHRTKTGIKPSTYS